MQNKNDIEIKNLKFLSEDISRQAWRECIEHAVETGTLDKLRRAIQRLSSRAPVTLGGPMTGATPGTTITFEWGTMLGGLVYHASDKSWGTHT